jgi:cysteine desulfurase
MLLEAARRTVAEMLAVRPDEVAFCASHSQAVQLAVLGSLLGRERTGSVLVHSAVEHSTVFKAADWHVAHGGSVAVASVDSWGRVDADQFTSLCASAGVAAAVLQAANHEVGTRQPLDVIVPRLRALGVPLIVDASHDLLFPAAQTPGWEMADAVIGDARLWGGPAGAAVLVIRSATRWINPFPAGAEVPATTRDRIDTGVDVPTSVAAAAALRAFRQQAAGESSRLRALVDRLRADIPDLVPDCDVLGDPVDRLPHIVTFSFLDVGGEALLSALDRRGFSVSSGSSCTSDSLTPSHVLVAMGALTAGNIRISLHPDVTDADVGRFLAALPDAVAQVRAELPGSSGPSAPPGDPVGGAEVIVDSRGRRCPLPVLDLGRAIHDVPPNGFVTVLADDPAAANDIAAWARMRGHQLVSATPSGGDATAYRIRRLS